MIFLPRSSCAYFTRKVATIQHVAKRFLGSGVYISQSHDIFQNLALEDWIYEHVQCESKDILLLWQNKPCVVIGRHQNPWTEVNLDLLNNKGIPLARRKSGGGTVYHDMGNLNCTFFTTRKRYDRRHNLELVVKAMKDTWDLNVNINERDDILLNDRYKISGTAAKLGKRTAYHHFTLLLNVDKQRLYEILNAPVSDFSTKATESVKSEVMNLMDMQPNLSHNELIRAISEEYYNSVLYLPEVKPVFLDPTNSENFPGIEEICLYLKSWKWKYGWTPKFTIQKTFTSKTFSQNNSEYLESSSKSSQDNNKQQDISNRTSLPCVTIDLECNKGCIEHVRLSSREINGIDQYASVIEGILKGVQFNSRDVETKLLACEDVVMETEMNLQILNWVLSCIRNMTVPVS